MPKRFIPILPGFPIFTPEYVRHSQVANVPRADPDDLPYRCYHIHVDYAPFLIAACDYYVHSDAFTGDLEAREQAAARFVNLQVQLMTSDPACEGETMLEFRQNTLNPCLLEYSTDGGNTWASAFDYSKCLRRNATINLTWEQLGDQYITNNATFNTYNGDIANVAPGWQYGDPDDDYRDMAMCWAAERWVQMCVDTAIAAGYASLEERQDKMYWVSNAFTTLGDVASALAEIGVYKAQAEIVAVVAEIASEVVVIAANLAGFDPSALSDQDAQTEVACGIYGALAGAKPTFAAWSAALVSHGFIGNEGEIADAAYLMMQSEELYVQFLMFAAEIIPAAELAGDLGCPCDNEWEVLVDLTEASLPDFLVVNWGLHVTGVGVFVAPHQAQGYNQLSCDLKFTPLSTNWALTNVYAEYAQISWGELPNNYAGITFYGSRLDPPEAYTARQWVRAEIAAPEGSRESGVNVTGVNNVYVQLRVSKFTPSGQGVIKTLRLRGLGTNPFI